MWGKKTRRIVELEATLRERDRQLDQLRNDFEQLRADYNAIVATIGNIATRPIGNRALMDQDIYREDDSLPDEWVSPPEGAVIDPHKLIEELEAQVGEPESDIRN